jgi:hypothetical protein
MRQQILAGNKSETRRKWKKPHVKVGGIYQVRLGRYKKGYHFLIRVLEVKKQKLGDMTEEDALAEGFRPGPYLATTMPASFFFFDYWMKLNGNWCDDDEVYVIKFCIASEGEKKMSDDVKIHEKQERQARAMENEV